MHINATSIFINDDETGLREDFERWIEIFYPHKGINKYKHNRTGEDNEDAHLKRQIMGREVVIAITKGNLDFPVRTSILWRI
ncbi:MAG TPA: YjbQ family protein [Nitrososphaeraceae archaeon]|nr:YjbQ family protein [Nitrososphaeraceae archaeon]